MDVVITMVKSGNDVVILSDGKVIDHWYLDTYEDELPFSKVDILNEFLFGNKKRINICTTKTTRV